MVCQLRFDIWQIDSNLLRNGIRMYFIYFVSWSWNVSNEANREEVTTPLNDCFLKDYPKRLSLYVSRQYDSFSFISATFGSGWFISTKISSLSSQLICLSLVRLTNNGFVSTSIDSKSESQSIESENTESESESKSPRVLEKVLAGHLWILSDPLSLLYQVPSATNYIMELIPTEQGNPSLILYGCRYNQYQTTSIGKQWRCSQQPHCFAAMWTTEDHAKVVQGPTEHSHFSEWRAMTALQVVDRLKQDALVNRSLSIIDTMHVMKQNMS